MEVIDIMMCHSPQHSAEIETQIETVSSTTTVVCLFFRQSENCQLKAATQSADIGPVTRDFDHHPVQEAGGNLQRMCSSQKNVPARKKFRVQVERISHHGCILWQLFFSENDYKMLSLLDVVFFFLVRPFLAQRKGFVIKSDISCWPLAAGKVLVLSPCDFNA